MERGTLAQIDLRCLKHNLACVRKYAPHSKIMAVVKANAYGHGLLPVTKALAQADAFAVATLNEGIQIRQSGSQKPILLLEGFLSQRELEACAQYQFLIVVHHQRQIDLLAAYQGPYQFSVWLKVDTGMHRLGFNLSQFELAEAQLRTLSSVDPHIRLMSHFCCADEQGSSATQVQLERFKHLSAKWQGEKTLANSAGIIQWPESHFDWVRPGAMLYGISPVIGQSAQSLGLKPVMTLQARVIAVNKLSAGEHVGYGACWTSAQSTHIAIVSIGYGDGYPRSASSYTEVIINQHRYPLAGRVSMDMIAVDIGLDSGIKPGDRVECWGASMPIDNVAHSASTIGYDLLLRLTSRVGLEYIE